MIMGCGSMEYCCSAASRLLADYGCCGGGSGGCAYGHGRTAREMAAPFVCVVVSV